MKNKIIIISVLAILLGTLACTKKDIEVSATREMTDNYFKTDDQASAALMAAYDPMGWVWINGNWGASLKTWGNFASDDAYTGGQDNNDQATYQACNTHTVSPIDNGSNMTNLWTAYFQGNFRANLILKNVKTDDTYRASVAGQAKFLKGFYYFYLARMFGGLPLVKTVPAANDLVKRSSLDETYTYIEELLTDAINNGNLQERTGPTDPANGLATKASAQALLGKVYMYHGAIDKKYFASAIPYLKAVADNPNYSLEPGFWKIFSGKNRHGIESVFEINFSSELGAGWEGNSDIYLMGPRASVSFNDTIVSGWGFDQPTQNLVDAFTAQNDNVRLQATVFFEDSLQKWYNRYNKNNTVLTWVNPHDKGYNDRKHYPDARYVLGGTGNYYRYSNPDIILRLADVYLLLAEASFRTGDNATALTYVNTVRNRVKLASLTSVTLADIKNERRLELALEGDRYFDLFRWNGWNGKTGSEAAESGDVDQIDANHVLGPLGYATGTPGQTTHGLFPIPQGEINRTTGALKLTQNDGY